MGGTCSTDGKMFRRLLRNPGKKGIIILQLDIMCELDWSDYGQRAMEGFYEWFFMKEIIFLPSSVTISVYFKGRDTSDSQLTDFKRVISNNYISTVS